MSLRQRDVEQWMSHRRLAQDVRRYLLIPQLFSNTSIVINHN
jgi:hypothetical protein